MKLVLDHERFDEVSCLCDLTTLLYEEYIISNDEEELIDEYIALEAPPVETYCPYRWPRGDMEIRRYWLEEEIKRLKYV